MKITGESKERMNVLVAGDTAGIFFILSKISEYPINIWLADAGIKRPLSEIPSHNSKSVDKANVFYDYITVVGAGVIRRMDSVITPEDIAGITANCKMYGIPLCSLNEAQGTESLNGNLSLVDGVIAQVTGNKIIPVETTHGICETIQDILNPSETLIFNDKTPSPQDILSDLGVPELEILTINTPNGIEYRELTGDLERVFGDFQLVFH